MSDFFGEDFTAELRAYFLNSVISDVEKFRDLIDDKLWKRIASEFSEHLLAWSVDARTNEFTHLAGWMEHYSRLIGELDAKDGLFKSLDNLKSYAVALTLEKVDSAELAARFAVLAANSQDVSYLHCRSGKQDFAIPLLSVIEISGKLPLFPLPEKRRGILGVVPYRGDAIPVISLQEYGFQEVDAKNIFYVVCEHAGRRFTLQVTATEDLMNLKGTDLQDVEAHASIMKVAFVRKFFIKNNRSVMVLDLEQLVAA